MACHKLVMASQVEHCTNCSGRLKMLGLHIHRASQLGLWCYERELMWHQIFHILEDKQWRNPSPKHSKLSVNVTLGICSRWLHCLACFAFFLCSAHFARPSRAINLLAFKHNLERFFWRGCLPSKASRSNNRLHCLRECTSAAATKGRAPLSHRFSMYVHVGVVGYTWAFRCGYKIRFSKLLKLLVFNYTLLHLDVLVWVTDLFFFGGAPETMRHS